MEESKVDKLERQLIEFDVNYVIDFPYQMMVLNEDWKPINH